MYFSLCVEGVWGAAGEDLHSEQQRWKKLSPRSVINATSYLWIFNILTVKSGKSCGSQGSWSWGNRVRVTRLSVATTHTERTTHTHKNSPWTHHCKSLHPFKGDLKPVSIDTAKWDAVWLWPVCLLERCFGLQFMVYFFSCLSHLSCLAVMTSTKGTASLSDGSQVSGQWQSINHTTTCLVVLSNKKCF